MMRALIKAKTFAGPATTVTEDSTPIYDGKTDIWQGVSEAYQTIRQRMHRGGPGWTAGGDGATDHKILIQRDGAREEWLVVHPNGRIEDHVENDGPASRRHGPQARDQWIDLDHVRNYWPEILPQVEAALAALGAQQ
jgi:hypothetical protein